MNASLDWKLSSFWMFALAVIGLFSITETSAGETPQERLAKAEAMFQERCKAAGEKIYRTVENVEGVFLIKLRSSEINFNKQFEFDDPYGQEFGGDAYIKSFLRGHYEAETSGTPIIGAPPPPRGYKFVDAVDVKDGMRYRFTGSVREIEVQLSGLSGGGTVLNKQFVLDKVPLVGTPPRFGITHDDISTREDREFWIAGGSLKVIDLQSMEVIAERIGYMMDAGQGNVSGGRSPWLLATNSACPTFQLNPLRSPGQGFIARLRQTVRFVEKVLKPKLEN